jgi:hypothetical protein
LVFKTQIQRKLRRGARNQKLNIVPWREDWATALFLSRDSTSVSKNGDTKEKGQLALQKGPFWLLPWEPCGNWGP